jgi:hypothetical protein
MPFHPLHGQVGTVHCLAKPRGGYEGNSQPLFGLPPKVAVYKKGPIWVGRAAKAVGPP